MSSRLHVPRGEHAEDPEQGGTGWEGRVIWGMEKLEQASLTGIEIRAGTNVKHQFYTSQREIQSYLYYHQAIAAEQHHVGEHGGKRVGGSSSF